MYFQKVESDLSSVWTVGQVTSVETSKDGIVRKVNIEYKNSSEDITRVTNRTVRRVVRLFNVEDVSWLDDMAEVERLLCAMDENRTNLDPRTVKPLRLVRSPGGDFRVDPSTSTSTTTLSSAPSWANRPAAAPATRPAGRAELQVSVSPDKIDAPPVIPPHPGTAADDVLPVLEEHLLDVECEASAPHLLLPLACGCCCPPHHAFTSHQRHSQPPSFVPPPPSQEEVLLSWTTPNHSLTGHEDDLPPAHSLDTRDSLVNLLTAVNVDFTADSSVSHLQVILLNSSA